MRRVCNLDTCPMGSCTQNPELRKNFKGKPEYIINYLTFVAEALREYMAKLGAVSYTHLDVYKRQVLAAQVYRLESRITAKKPFMPKRGSSATTPPMRRMESHTL